MNKAKKQLTEKEVKKVADLARLPLTEKETKTFAQQLSEVINYVT